MRAALIEGFVEGYNRYVTETDATTFPAECQGQEWVKTISPVDLLAHYRIVGQYASGEFVCDWRCLPCDASRGQSGTVAGDKRDGQRQG